MPKDDKGKVKLTVIQFETESDNETLQENIKSITNTLARALAPQPRIIQVPAQIANGSGDNSTDGSKDSVQGSLFDNQDDDAVDGEVTSSTKSKAKSGTSRSLPTPETLDVDLITGEVPLKAFIEGKKPSGDSKKYLAIAYWFKNYRSVNEINMNHAYTCYRILGWNVPKDASMPLRNLKKQGWMKKGNESGAYAINHVGENVVNEMK